jgi:hypothetical protein
MQPPVLPRAHRSCNRLSALPHMGH